MEALVVDPAARAGLSIGSRPEPVPGRSQLVLEVAAFSLVDRDLRYAPGMLGPGEVWGFDAAGVVAVAAADGSGPPAGTHVVTVLPAPGAWARRIAVDSADVAILPDGVDAGTATALALPGISALQAVGVFGTLLGRRLLVTGASGAVGWYAVQLATRAGAHVVAAVRNHADSDALAEIGAAEIVTDLGQVSPPVDGVLDVVGGP
uniref:alcohol dehydrogenase n=1 Tax=Candidatus Protofrankia californiensis TaxID=1839754 RepID=UPI00104122FA